MYITEVVTNTIISVTGILGTVIVGSVGLYFTARSRTSPNRQVLFTKQIELMLKIFRATGTAKNLTTLLRPDSEHQNKARDELIRLAAELMKLSYEAAILFPAELYVTFKKFSETLTDIITEFDKGRDIVASCDGLRIADTHFALMARQLIGADELSIESLQLHSKKNALEQLGRVEVADAIRFMAENDKGQSAPE